MNERGKVDLYRNTWCKMMYSRDVGEPLSITLVPLADQIFHFGSEISQQLLDRLAFGTDTCGASMMYAKGFLLILRFFSRKTQRLNR